MTIDAEIKRLEKIVCNEKLCAERFEEFRFCEGQLKIYKLWKQDREKLEHRLKKLNWYSNNLKKIPFKIGRAERVVYEVN